MIVKVINGIKNRVVMASCLVNLSFVKMQSKSSLAVASSKKR